MTIATATAVISPASTSSPSSSSTTCRTPPTTESTFRCSKRLRRLLPPHPGPASRAGSGIGSRCVSRRSRPCATRCRRATAQTSSARGPRPPSPTARCASPRACTTRRARHGGPLNWSRNWASLAVRPLPARDAGRLYDPLLRRPTRLVLDGQASNSLVSTSVNFGIVADAAKSSPFDGTTGFATPIIRPLVGVQAREDQDASASQVFEGPTAKGQGDTPAMAFVIGADLLFDNGWVRLVPGVEHLDRTERTGRDSAPSSSATPRPRRAAHGPPRRAAPWLERRTESPETADSRCLKRPDPTQRAPARLAGCGASSSRRRSCRSRRA